MKQKTKTIALIAIIVMTAFVAMCAFSSAAVEEDTSDKISGYLKYTMKQGYLEMEPVEKPDITAVGKPVKPLKIAMAEDKVAKGVKGVRERETLPSVIGGVIITESPLTEDQVKQLESLGVEIRSRMGTVTTVNMPKDKIQDIASLDYIRYIEGARPVRMHLDAAVPEMGADQAWTDGYTGDDVIIGIADSGIDVNHGDFYFDAAKTDSKILYLWDQEDDLTGPAPAPYGYGTEWTKAQIDAGLCTETDTYGHGTHVAGTAASIGLETGNYPGVAPRANIISVKTTFLDTDIIDGWKYIVDRAQAEGKPCVISCSIGTYFSPHDGTDPMAQAADWCAAQGVLVICSAGNDGDWPVHATIQQPRTEMWSDDFDSGFGNWVTDGGDPTWHRVTDRSTSPDYSTYPGTCDICEYVNDQDSTMTMASSIDLSTATSPEMTFQLWSEIESGWDYLDVDVSSDGGTTWTNEASYDGDMSWTGQSIDLSSYTSDQVKIRFRFVSDDSYTYEGPYIDDVAISDGAITLWSDDFESGFGNWVTDGGDPTWHLEDSRSYSGSYSAYPGTCDICEYINDQYSTMTMANSIDLSTTTSPEMTFQLWSEIESGWDYLDVDVSSDGGMTWTNEAWYDGDMDWTGQSIDLSSYTSDQVKIRFRFVSDGSVTYEGPYIDDVVISDGATTLWSDDFESGFGNWVTDGGDPTWHQEDSRSYSGSYSAYPGTCDICKYVNDQDSTMTMANSIDLSTTTYPVLAFQLWSDIEIRWDSLYVDVSSDGGTNWRAVWSYGNHDRNWRGMIVDLTPYKSDQVKVRFRFVSDGSYTYEGPYIDDVAIYDQSGVCGGGTYQQHDTYNLEVALDPWYRDSLVDLYYDLDDNVSIEVWTSNGYVSADEADAYDFGADWEIEVYYVEGPNWKNYFIYAFDMDPFRNEMIEIHVDAVGPGGVNRWDAWTQHPLETYGYFRDVDDMDYFMSVGSPASAQNAIAVGAYTTKDCWDDIGGNYLCYTRAVMDDLAYFSSHGPTRDCRMKPELTASGFGVMSALSGDSWPHPWMVDPDGAHQMMAGTSMSAPMVAGAVALGLECNPDASPSELRSYFMETAREDAYTGDTWPDVDNQYWGAGKILSDPPCYPRPPMPVPAFTPPSIIVLIGLLSLAGFVMLRRRE